MPKTRGLPDSFSLDVAEAALADEPVQLGDYLDEESTEPAPLPRPKPAPTLQVLTPTAEDRPEPRAPVPKLTSPPLHVPRKQVNMKPDTLRMTDDILNYVRTYSVQKDAKASELFDALVSAAHEALEHLDLGGIPPRGRWGTPTARAFPTALKNAIKAAVAEHYRRQQQ